ncbi:hypothetical protein EV702DRAFT_1244560 [Suillus placidus]|uniref:Uncharacterized protein n=1 Tax=Suillus placidus TaxID=48579 RepID=A0A9P7A317_9AGAM|nr:hypothetical protein EV702DRAFT_1244560 [Suillus placidus]
MAAIANVDAIRATAVLTSVAEPVGINATPTNTVAANVTEPAMIDAADTHAEATAFAQPAAIDNESDQPFEVCIIQQPKIKATVTKPGQASSTKSQKLKPSHENVHHKVTMQAAGPSQHTLDVESEDEVDHSKHIATMFECLEVVKKVVKAHKTKKQFPLKKGKGKEKAAPQILVVDSINEISDVSSSDRTFPSAVVIEPSRQRYCLFPQLLMADMNTNVNSIIIPLDLRTMPFEDDDNFLEALGMEHLYSAIVHMETHALNSSATYNDMDVLFRRYCCKQG